tara:strand:- start:4586 stop:5290 length:705 start_codon:yes stop_codon:yes gene_type:complete
MANGYNPDSSMKNQQGGFGYTSNPYSSSVGGSTNYGLASLTAGDFFNEDGNPKPIDELVALLQPHKPGVSREDLVNQIQDFMPKMRGVDKKELDFLDREKNIQQDIYGIKTGAAQRGLDTSLGQAQQQAFSLGSSMRGAYGGSGAGIRSSIQGQQGMGQNIDNIYGSYGDSMKMADIGQQRAGISYDKGVYGLQKQRASEFEGDLGNFLQGFKSGGKVKTFTEVLARIPDAKGS